MIRFDCPHCRRVLRVSDEFAGKDDTCPGCKRTLKIPQLSAPLPKPPPVIPARNDDSVAVPRRASNGDEGDRGQTANKNGDRAPSAASRTSMRKIRPFMILTLGLTIFGAIIAFELCGIGANFIYTWNRRSVIGKWVRDDPVPTVTPGKITILETIEFLKDGTVIHISLNRRYVHTGKYSFPAADRLKIENAGFQRNIVGMTVVYHYQIKLAYRSREDALVLTDPIGNEYRFVRY